MLYVDTRMWLPDDLLTAGDKMTMAASIEARVPYLDVELVEWLETLPTKFKLHRFSGKYIHKAAARAWLPESVVHRKKKGFANPVDRWLREQLRQPFDDLVFSKDSLASRCFRLDVIRSLVEQDRRGERDHKRHLFLLLALELWYRRFVTGEKN
jgi:asparagine synthase (glutamine-hydrolysing)